MATTDQVAGEGPFKLLCTFTHRQSDKAVFYEHQIVEVDTAEEANHLLGYAHQVGGRPDQQTIRPFKLVEEGDLVPLGTAPPSSAGTTEPKAAETTAPADGASTGEGEGATAPAPAAEPEVKDELAERREPSVEDKAPEDSAGGAQAAGEGDGAATEGGSSTPAPEGGDKPAEVPPAPAATGGRKNRGGPANG